MQDSHLSKFTIKQRLRSKDFEAIFARSEKVKRGQWTALYRLNGLPCNRLGIVIKKRDIPLAVDRNKIRRIVRESLRHAAPFIKGLDIVLLMRSKCSHLTNNHIIRNDLDQLWHALAASFQTH